MDNDDALTLLRPAGCIETTCRRSLVTALALAHASSHVYRDDTTLPSTGPISTWTVVATVYNNATGAVARLYRCPDTRTLVIAFRGIDDLTDVKHAMQAWPVCVRKELSVGDAGFWCNLGMCWHSKVHTGFWRQYVSLSDYLWRAFGLETMDMIACAMDRKPAQYKHVVFTCHSMGGALAVIASHFGGALVGNDLMDYRCVTFGAPRVLSRGKPIHGGVIDVTRYEADNDPVPHVPSRLRYAHVGTQVRLGGDVSFLASMLKWVVRCIMDRSPEPSAHSCETYMHHIAAAKTPFH